jgi:hypothetical protein
MCPSADVLLLPLDVHGAHVGVPHIATGFCSTSTATRLSATTTCSSLYQRSAAFFYSKAYFHDFTTSITSQHNKSGHFQTSWLLFPGYIITIQ